MADEVRIPPDRRREVAVGLRRETRVAEVLREVAGLVERTQQLRPERLARPTATTEEGSEQAGLLADPGGGVVDRHALRHGRGRHAEIGEALDQRLDRRRL